MELYVTKKVRWSVVNFRYMRRDHAIIDTLLELKHKIFIKRLTLESSFDRINTFC